jgi:copper oxidase (laccase) domain-containing protein
MRAEFGCDPADLIAAVGPAIGACCYTVGDEVEQRFFAGFGYAASLFERKDSGLYLNLAEANRRQLLASGVAEEKIAMLSECTACTREGGRRKYFSHRAEHGFTGRMMSAIGILDNLDKQ